MPDTTTTTRELLEILNDMLSIIDTTTNVDGNEKLRLRERIQASLALLDAGRGCDVCGDHPDYKPSCDDCRGGADAAQPEPQPDPRIPPLPPELPKWEYVKDARSNYEEQFLSALERHIRRILYPALTAERKARVDARECCKPEWDGTDGACPSWWRGSDRGWEAAQARLAEAEGLLKWFCDRVEAGEVRSQSTYAKFNAFLARKPDKEKPL